MNLKEKIRTIQDFPKKGILFRDITTLLKDKEAFHFVIDELYKRYKDKKINLIAGIESRGFIIGAALAYRLGCGFVPVRKMGKLPADTISEAYALEYGTDHLEIHIDAVRPGESVLIVDDLIATGGTLLATGCLIEQLQGIIIECCVVIHLPDLKGKEKLKWPCHSLIAFESH